MIRASMASQDTDFELLVLGGTAEARALAARLAARASLRVVTVRDRQGAADRRPGAIIDARHPFAPGAIEAEVPVLRLWRPEWRAGAGDDWHHVTDGHGAAALVPPDATVFVATGRGRLGELTALRDRTVWWRRRGPAPDGFPFARGGWLTGEGPFTAKEEEALFRRLGIDWLILQNAGGAGAWPKLSAARALGLSVAMIDRPARPEPSVATVDEAVAWFEAGGFAQ